MHEMALAESMLEIVEETARAERCVARDAVRLELGALSHVEPRALRFCFDAVTRGSVAEGARLEIVATPGRRGACRAANACRSRSSASLPALRQLPAPGVAGDAMRVKEIEIA